MYLLDCTSSGAVGCAIIVSTSTNYTAEVEILQVRYLVASLGHAARQVVTIESCQNSTHLGTHCVSTAPDAHCWSVFKLIVGISVVDTAPIQIGLVRPFPNDSEPASLSETEGQDCSCSAKHTGHLQAG